MKSLIVSGVAVLSFFIAPLALAQSYGCVSIPAGLTMGSRGSGVLSLQQFLVAQNYQGGGSWMMTGYFGQATAAAVRTFQTYRGLPQTGWVDAATASAMSAASCQGYSGYTGYGYTSTYPLNTYSYTPSSYNYNPYPYNQPYPNPNYPSYPSYSPSPTYNSCTYPYNTNNYGFNFNCPVHISSLSRSSGEVGDRITVYGNGFSSSGNTVRFGVGVAASNVSSSDNGTRLNFTVPTYLRVYGYSTERVYETSYPISVVNGSGYTSNQISFRVTNVDDNDNNNDDLEITSVSGPSSLDTGEAGTWTVKVRGGSSDYYSFSVDWDDDNDYPYYPYPYAQSSDFYQSNRLTHTYYESGTYDIRFTVRDGDGNTDSTTETVRVSGSNRETNDVSIDNMRFSPSVIYVSRGTTVEWTNDDNEDHTVTSDYNSFDSGRLDEGETYRRTFNTTGTYQYHCALHPEMRGVVIVR